MSEANGRAMYKIHLMQRPEGIVVSVIEANVVHAQNVIPLQSMFEAQAAVLGGKEVTIEVPMLAEKQILKPAENTVPAEAPPAGTALN